MKIKDLPKIVTIGIAANIISRVYHGNYKKRFIRKVAEEIASGIKIVHEDEAGYVYPEYVEFNDMGCIGRQICIRFTIEQEQKTVDADLLYNNLLQYGEFAGVDKRIRAHESWQSLPAKGTASEYWSRAGYSFSFNDWQSMCSNMRELQKWCTCHFTAPQPS